MMEATPTQSGLSFYQNPLDYLNNIRAKSNLNTLKPNQTLDKAARNHAEYVVLNNDVTHYESAGGMKFTGVSPSDRAWAVGYNSGVSENFSYNAVDLKNAIDGLMSAIYHRFAFLDFGIDEVGISYYDDSKNSSYVFEMGNSDLERFCASGRGDTGEGRFFSGMCKNKTQAIRDTKLERIKRVSMTPYVYYPNLEPAIAIFSGEMPDPYPSCKILSTPVSIEFNPHQNPVKMLNFEVFLGDKKVENTKIITKENDINSVFNKNQFAIFSENVFEFGAKYRAVFEYEQDETKKKIEWEFTTQTPKHGYFVVSGGENLALEPDVNYDIFFKPKNCNDKFESYKFSYSLMDKPLITTSGANMLSVKLSGLKGAKLKLRADNGSEIKLYLKNSSPNYRDERLKYYLIFAVLALSAIIYYFIRKR